MDIRRILLYIVYQYRNQLRAMPLKSKLLFALDWLDAFINPIFFSAIFFIANPDNALIIFISSIVYFFSAVNHLESTKKIISQEDYRSSFQLVGLSKNDYVLGVDIINTLPTFISNLCFSLFILMIISQHYPNIFYQALLFQLVLLIGLPAILCMRLLFLKFSQPILLVLSKVFNYHVWVWAIVFSRMANIHYNQTFILLMLVCLTIGIYSIKKIFDVSIHGHSSSLMIELKIALAEANFPFLTMLFVVGIWLILSLVVLIKMQTEFPSSEYAKSFNAIGLIHIYTPLMLVSLIHTGLSYYYGYDLEGMRMRAQRYLGEFIHYKIRHKIILSYVLSIVPYVLFIGVYLFFCNTSFCEAMKYSTAYCLGILLQPLSFFVGTLLFPNYRRSMFNFEQRMTNSSLIFGIVFSSVLALGSGYYVWKSSSVLSIYILAPIILNIAIFVINLFIIQIRSKQLRR